MNVSVRLENTFSMPTMVQQVADGVTYMQLYNEAVFNTAKETGTLHAYQPFYSADKINGTKAGLNKYLYPNNDWYDLMFKDFRSTRTSTSTSAAAAVRSATSSTQRFRTKTASSPTSSRTPTT